MKNPAISVIVPVYNTEQYLPGCIDSILAQTFTDFELLLVDDGSKDSSGAICDEYAAKDARIQVFHIANSGVSSARNLGLDNAKGEYITFCDSDDYIENNMLELLVHNAYETASDIVFSDFYFDYSDKISHYLSYDWDVQGKSGLEKYIATTWTCLWGSLQRTSLYSDNNIRLPLGISFCEDFHVTTRLCYFAHKITKVHKPLYHYRQHESSVLHNFSNKHRLDEQWVYHDIIDFFKKNDSYNDFKKVMAWRSLKSTQDLVLNTNTFNQFINYNPDVAPYILSCPFIGKKLKIMSWCLTHHLKFITFGIVIARKLLKR